MPNKKESNKISDKITRISEFGAIVSGLLILIAGLLITYGVILRYFFKHPTIWELEMATFLLIASAFFASPSAIHHNAHVSLDIVTSKLKERPRNILYIITGILGVIFAIVICERGIQLWLEAYQHDWRSGSIWNPKLVYPYAIIPIGMIWFAVQYFIEIRKKIRSLSKQDFNQEQSKLND